MVTFLGIITAFILIVVASILLFNQLRIIKKISKIENLQQKKKSKITDKPFQEDIDNKLLCSAIIVAIKEHNRQKDRG